MSPEHINHPYPTEKEKAKMVSDTGIELKRLNNWFVNNRIRYWKPRMEALQRKKRLNQGPGSVNEDSKQSSSDSQAATSSFIDDVRVFQEALSTPPENEIHSASSSVYFISDVSSAANESSISEDEDVGDTGFSDSVCNDTIAVSESDLYLSSPIVGLKRRYEEASEGLHSPRSKYRRKNINLWRVICESTPRTNHEDLPSLDEAARLFGYASDQ
jgi:hypothetical protein